MIHFLVQEAHRYTIDSYLKEWGGPLREHLVVVPYERLRQAAPFADGVYIFAGVDRLTGAMQRLALEFHEALKERGDAVRVLNHPQRTARRFELLQVLHASGQNDFRAYRVVEQRSPARFPVFLRLENAHTANLTPLLHNQAQLDQHISRVEAEIRADGYPPEELMMVEFLDTSDGSGVFKKYGTYILGDRVLPRYISFDTAWVVKRPHIVDERKLAEEEEYVRGNPHREELLAIATGANIQFGRFDYTVFEGRLQVWEINTNPALGLRRKDYHRVRLPLVERFAKNFGSALMELALAYPSETSFSFAPTPAVAEESLRPESRPPAFIRPGRVTRRIVDKMPLPVRKALRRAALRLQR